MDFNNSEDNYLYFNSPLDVNFGYLSIDYKHTIIINNKKFNSIREYYEYKKSKLFNDKLPNEKKLGILIEANFYKFTQNLDLQEKLLNTYNKFICYTSLDTELGIGLNKDIAIKTAIDEWKGWNLLGIAIMEVRLELIKNNKNK